MHSTVKNLNSIKNNILEELKKINQLDKIPNIVAISKTFPIDKITPLIEIGHVHFGENKVQEALLKWSKIKHPNKNIKLHLVGKLQSNKVKLALELFDYIHSLDNIKLARKISELQKKINKRPKLFIQINIGNEDQKNGIPKGEAFNFLNLCNGLNLDIIGTMCIPPNNQNTDFYFSEMKKINEDLNFKELSMGMSEDYLKAINFSSTFLRIGSQIFGSRS